MPISLKKGGAAKIKKGQKKATTAFDDAIERIDVTLPTELSEPAAKLTEYVTMIYGPPGQGKTTVAGQAGEAFFMMFETGGRGYQLYQKPIPTWPHALAYVKRLRSDKKYDVVVTDCIDPAWNMYFDWFVKSQLDGMHPHDKKDHGKSWSELRRTFERSFLDPLLKLENKGLFFLAHEREVGEDDEVKWTRPNLSGQPFGIMEPHLDFMFWLGTLDDGKRWFVVDGSDMAIVTKRRSGDQFIARDGLAITKIPAGNSEAEAWTNLVAAFEGRQETYNGETVKPARPTKAAGKIRLKKDS